MLSAAAGGSPRASPRVSLNVPHGAPVSLKEIEKSDADDDSDESTDDESGDEEKDIILKLIKRASVAAPGSEQDELIDQAAKRLSKRLSQATQLHQIEGTPIARLSASQAPQLHLADGSPSPKRHSQAPQISALLEHAQKALDDPDNEVMEKEWTLDEIKATLRHAINNTAEGSEVKDDGLSYLLKNRRSRHMGLSEGGPPAEGRRSLRNSIRNSVKSPNAGMQQKGGPLRKSVHNFKGRFSVRKAPSDAGENNSDFEEEGPSVSAVPSVRSVRSVSRLSARLGAGVAGVPLASDGDEMTALRSSPATPLSNPLSLAVPGGLVARQVSNTSGDFELPSSVSNPSLPLDRGRNNRKWNLQKKPTEGQEFAGTLSQDMKTSGTGSTDFGVERTISGSGTGSIPTRRNNRQWGKSAAMTNNPSQEGKNAIPRNSSQGEVLVRRQVSDATVDYGIVDHGIADIRGVSAPNLAEAHGDSSPSLGGLYGRYAQSLMSLDRIEPRRSFGTKTALAKKKSRQRVTTQYVNTSAKSLATHIESILENEQEDPTCSASRKRCTLCFEEYRGHGDLCANCRKHTKNGGENKQCPKCGAFYNGFTQLCDDCSFDPLSPLTSKPPRGSKPSQGSVPSLTRSRTTPASGSRGR